MKKLTVVLAIILMMGAARSFVFSEKSSAVEMEEDGVIWYGVPELLEYKKIIDQEAMELCGKKVDCIKAYRSEKRSQNEGKYLAMYSMELDQFLITEIKPKTETIKILVFDEHIRNKFEGNGEIREIVLKNLYIGWFDGAPDKNYFDDNYPALIDSYYNNEVLGAHRVFSRLSAIDGANWLEKYNEEVEFPMGEGSRMIDNRGTLSYKFAAVKHMNKSGTFGFGHCLGDENYDAEVGCRLMVSSKGVFEYFAIPKAVDDEIADESNDSDYDEIDSEGNEGQEDDETEQESDEQEKPGDNTDLEDQGEQGKVEKEQTNIIVRSPDTGTFTNPCPQKTVEFPWWLVVIIALGDVVALWLFWPKKSKKS